MADENWNPYFKVLWEHCHAKPLAVEDHPWGETVFKVRGKVFAFLGHPEDAGVTVKISPDALDALLALPFIQRAHYIGRYGWITVSVQDAKTLELALELVDKSHDLIAAKQKRGKRNHTPP